MASRFHDRRRSACAHDHRDQTSSASIILLLLLSLGAPAPAPARASEGGIKVAASADQPGASSGTEADAERQGREIMKQNDAQMSTHNRRAEIVMSLVGRSGRTQTRHLLQIAKTGKDGLERNHLRFVDPPSIRGTTLLIIENIDREDDVWLYLPAIHKTRRLSGANMSASYMGSEFSYKDLKREKISPEDNRYVLVGEEELDSVPHHVVDAFPVSDQEKDEQGYSRRRFWVRHDASLVSRVEYYDLDGTLLKTLVASDMRPVGDSGKVRFNTLTMTNVKGVKTVLEFRSRTINTEDPEDWQLSKAALGRP